MEHIDFTWDQQKNRLNQKKHRISFEEAKTVFSDENARLLDDPDHSEDEDRFILLGISIKLRLLVVCHCIRNEGNLIRFISARKATKREEKYYVEVLS